MTSEAGPISQVGVVARTARRWVARAGLELAGFRTLEAEHKRVWDAYAEGRVQRIVCLEGRDDEHAARAESAAPGAIMWAPDDEAAPVLDALVASLPAHLAGRPPERVRFERVDLDPLELLGALVALRPTMKVVIERDSGAIALCLVEGRVLSAAHEGRRLFDDPDLAADPGLALIADLWKEASARLEGRDALVSDLVFACEHDWMLERSPAFAAFVERALGSLVRERVTGLDFEAHAPSRHGLPLADRARRALLDLAPEERRRRIGPGRLTVADDRIPDWLRGALPPARFGKVFFQLGDGATLEELRRNRLDDAELESGLLLGVITGVVTPPPLELGRELTPRPLPDPVTRFLEARALATRAARRPRLFVPALAGAEEVELVPCGSPAAFFHLLSKLGEPGERLRRLSGTRLTPLGVAAGPVLSYYRISEDPAVWVEVVLVDDGREARALAGKRLKPDRAREPGAIARFEAEARLLERLDHPHIVKGYGALTHGEQRVMLMELVHGVTLDELVRALVRRGRTAPPPVVRAIGVAVARALAYVHDRRTRDGRPLGMVHGDVCPRTVLVSFAGDVKLVGFSQAVLGLRDAPLPSDVRRGRLGYLAPEALGQAPTWREDQFALAACLYELVTGVHRGELATAGDPLDATLLAAHLPVRELDPRLPARLAYAIERAFAAHPSERFASMQALEAALVADGEVASREALAGLVHDLFGDLEERELEALRHVAPIRG